MVFRDLYSVVVADQVKMVRCSFDVVL